MDAYKTVEMSPAIKATYQEALTSKAKLGHDFLNLIHVVYEAPGALISPKKNGVENTIPTSTTGLVSGLHYQLGLIEADGNGAGGPLFNAP